MTTKISLTVVFLLTLSISQGFPMLLGETDNALLLNGWPLKKESFSTISYGKLSLVKGNPKTEKPDYVAFSVYLKRKGKVIAGKSNPQCNSVKSVELSELLKYSMGGDELVIDPVDKKQNIAPRVIVITPGFTSPILQWFLALNRNDDGC